MAKVRWSSLGGWMDTDGNRYPTKKAAEEATGTTYRTQRQERASAASGSSKKGKKGTSPRTPKKNPQSRRQTLAKQAGFDLTPEIANEPWPDFQERVRSAGVDPEKPKRTPRKKSGGSTKAATVTIGQPVVPPNVTPPSPKDEKKPKRTKKKPKSVKRLTVVVDAPKPPPPPPPASSTAPPPPPKPTSATPKTASNPFADIFGSGSEPKKKKAPRTYFGKKAPKGQMGAMVAQQRQSPHNLATTSREVSGWLGRVGSRIKREAAATVADVNRIAGPRTRVVTGRPSAAGPQMTNARTSSRATSVAPAPPSPSRPPAARVSVGPQMTNVRVGPTLRAVPKRQVPFSVQTAPRTDYSGSTRPQMIGPRGYPMMTGAENRSAARAGVEVVRRGPAQGGAASAVSTADSRPRRPRAPVNRDIKSVKKNPIRISAAHGWSPNSARFASVTMPETIPGLGDRRGTFGFLRENRRQFLGGGNFKDRAPVVRDISPKTTTRRGLPSMSGSGMGSGSPAQPTTPTGRPKKTSYKPQTLSPPINPEKAKRGVPEPGASNLRPATPPSSVPPSSATTPTRSSDAAGRTKGPAKVVFRSDTGNYVTRSGRELSFFGPNDRTPRIITPVSPKGSKSPTRLPSKSIDWTSVARDMLSDMESDWTPDDLKKAVTDRQVGKVAKAVGISEPKAREYVEGKQIDKMRAKYPNPFLTRSGWLGDNRQNVNMPRTSLLPEGERKKTGFVKLLQKRGLLGLAGGAVGTGVGAAVDVLASPDKAYAPMSPKARAEQTVFLRERAASRKRALTATKKVFPTFTQPGYRRSK